MDTIKKPYHLFSNPALYYKSMLKSISNAKKYIYVETFRLGRDTIGEQFRDALTTKARQGIEVKVLIDYWGARALDDNFFKSLTQAGGKVRFFEKIKFNTDSRQCIL